ncbi:MAG: PorT family protein [Chitinophagaceae bacterium]|nr:MAG: PorT family protein [Chitinophagaceae bacterium]
MNRQSLLLIFTGLIVLQVRAQENPLKLYLKGGLNISSGLVSTPTKYSGTGIGFHAGVVGDYRISDQFSIQPGALLSSKNAKIKDLNGITINMLTLDIPVLAVYHKDKFFAGLGPDFNFGLTGKFKYRDSRYDLFDKESDARFSIKRLEIAASLMAGYFISEQLFVSAGFNLGLNNLFNYSEVTNSSTKVRTSIIGLSVGYAIGR